MIKRSENIEIEEKESEQLHEVIREFLKESEMVLKFPLKLKDHVFSIDEKDFERVMNKIDEIINP